MEINGDIDFAFSANLKVDLNFVEDTNSSDYALEYLFLFEKFIKKLNAIKKFKSTSTFIFTHSLTYDSLKIYP